MNPVPSVLNCLFAGGTEAYLTWVFVRVGTHRHKYDLSAADLTPAAYKQALER